MSLDQFIEPIKVAGKLVGKKYKAYKMDSNGKNNNMRKMVGLGTCHCCDYFLPRSGSIILIEETRLLEKVKKIRKKYNYLKDGDKDDIVNNLIRDRMQLKAYGSMLILCRLASNCSDIKKLIQNNKCCFWFVASSINSEDEKRFFDNLKDSLRRGITQVLGKISVDDVDVMSSDILKKRISNNDSNT